MCAKGRLRCKEGVVCAPSSVPRAPLCDAKARVVCEQADKPLPPARQATVDPVCPVPADIGEHQENGQEALR